MYNFLAESFSYKVYSMEDYVYLKQKSTCRTLNEHDKTDIRIGWMYGNPTSALIMYDEKYIIIAGCGLLVFDIAKGLETTLLAESGNITWTNALHQEIDDANTEFRYVAYSGGDIPRVFKMSILTQETILLN